MQRHSQVTWPVKSKEAELNEWNWTPNLGFRYDLTPNTQWFASLNRSFEAPHAWSMVWSSDRYFDSTNNGGNTASNGRQREPIQIDTQKANTLEIGGRGESRIGQWNAAYYYSKIKNELLAVELQGSPIQFIKALKLVWIHPYGDMIYMVRSF